MTVQVPNVNHFKTQYPHSKPPPGPVIYITAFVNFLGLAGLFITTHSAYDLVAGFWQSFFLAVLIEAALVVEAWLVMSRAGSIWAWIALITKVVLSGFFAYAQFSNAPLEDGVTIDTLTLLAFSLGPVTAIATMSLAFGKALRNWQDLVDTWDESRASWAVDQWEKAKAAALRAQRKAEKEAARLAVESAGHNAAQETQTGHNAPHNAAQGAESSQNGHNAAQLPIVPLADRKPDQDQRLANLYQLTEGKVFGWVDLKDLDGHDVTQDIFNKLVKYGQEVGAVDRIQRGRYTIKPVILEWVDTQEVF